MDTSTRLHPLFLIHTRIPQVMANLNLPDNQRVFILVALSFFVTSCASNSFEPSRSARLLDQIQSLRLIDRGLVRQNRPKVDEPHFGVNFDRSLFLDEYSIAVLQINALSGNPQAWIKLGDSRSVVGENQLAVKLYEVARQLGHPLALARLEGMRN